MHGVLKTALLPIALPFRLRFTAGPTIHGALKAACDVRATGATPILNYLGEHLQDPLLVHEQVLVYLEVLKNLSPGDRISVKPSQLGLDIPGCGTWHARQNLHLILTEAHVRKILIELDMENVVRAEPTLELALWANATFSQRTRVAIAARMYKSEAYINLLCRNRIPIRLVKGAYEDMAEASLQKTNHIRFRYAHLASLLLREGTAPAFATHDQELIDFIKQETNFLGISKDRFEFDFLKGFRPHMQHAMTAQGFRVGVYVPFGPTWFEYGIRRWKFFRRSPKDLFRALVG